ncbi:MAG: metalloregulator ArsR/SmtB family transcription factor [archaeon]
MKKHEFLKALSDETRLKILEFLKNGEQCACKIVPYTKKSQPNVSLHLKKLEEAGILKSRKDGTNILYKISDKKAEKILRLLED